MIKMDDPGRAWMMLPVHTSQIQQDYEMLSYLVVKELLYPDLPHWEAEDRLLSR